MITYSESQKDTPQDLNHSMSRLQDLHTLVKLSKSYVSGVSTDHVTIDGETINYIVAGDPKNEAVVFIHCFNGTKNLWRLMMDRLKNDYFVIAPEVPGLSIASDLSDDKKYSFRYLIALIEKFIETMNLTKVHLVGASAGSTIAAHLMLRNPELVETMAMFALPSLFREMKNENTVPLEFYIPTSFSEFQNLKNFLVYDPPPTSDWTLKNMARKNRSKRALKLKILEDCITKTSLLVPRLRQIRTPTLFLYGDNDRVTPQYTIDHFVQEVPNIQHYKIEMCGHIPYMERPDEVVATYLSFLSYNQHYCRRTNQQSRKPGAYA